MDAILEELLRHGVALVGLNVFLQQLGLPIPSVPTMMVAAALAVDGRISAAGVFAVAVAASVVADSLWFWAGRRYGYPVLRLLCRMSLSPDACVRQTEGIFERWGFYSLVVSKFVPGFSTVAPRDRGRAADARAVVPARGDGERDAVGGRGHGRRRAVPPRDRVAARLDGPARGARRPGARRALRALRRVQGRGSAGRARAYGHRRDDRQRRPLARARGRAAPLVVDVGSRLAHRSRPHIPGAMLARPGRHRRRDGRAAPRSRHRLLLRLPERDFRAARGADPARARAPRRARARRRPRRLDRRRRTGGAGHRGGRRRVGGSPRGLTERRRRGCRATCRRAGRDRHRAHEVGLVAASRASR
ncbi:MAG: hypothetical protein MZV65_48990 [Chromatiales bacterium]|nr:hypothetical protein [Chromatiales bacterium]